MLSSFNQTVFKFFFYKIPHVELLNVLGIFAAEYLPYLLIIGFLILAYYQASSRRRVYVFCEGALAVILSRGIITEIIRFFYHHQRPYSFYNFTPLISESGWSFPSGHATFFFALAMTIWYIDHKWGWTYFALVTIMAIARVYVGVHWPLDIIGGAIIGIGSAMFVHWLLRKSRQELS
jgi:undecaprenyl-diphosphatase